MNVGGAGKRHEDGGLPCRGDFGNGAGPGAADEQVGAGEHAGHVVNELVDFAGNSRTLVGVVNMIVVALAGLVDDVDARNSLFQSAEGFDHGLIDGTGALTASENK